jgi:hypothetical protein
MDSDEYLRHAAWQDCDPTRPQPRYTRTDGRFAPWVRGTRRTGAGLAAEAAVAGRDVAEFAGPLPGHVAMDGYPHKEEALAVLVLEECVLQVVSLIVKPAAGQVPPQGAD